MIPLHFLRIRGRRYFSVRVVEVKVVAEVAVDVGDGAHIGMSKSN